jgi:hypothetical protein
MTNSTAAAAGLLLPNTQQTGDLLGRLQSFLPQLQAANQALEDDEDGDPRVDVDLEQEDEDGGLVDDDDDDDEKEAKEEDNSDHQDHEKHPTIQIQFELGDVDKNPILSSLLADNPDPDNHRDDHAGDHDGDDSSGSNEHETETDHPAKSLVSNLLTTTTSTTIAAPKPDSSSAFDKKRKLITELE